MNAVRLAWDERAREDPLLASATNEDPWTEEAFFESGRRHVRDQILSDMGNVCGGRDPKSMTVLELGCGAGRVTGALAEVFGTVYAVDVSGEMVAAARRRLIALENAFFFRTSGSDLAAIDAIVEDGTFDFAFSSLTFQHIASLEVIESLVRDVRRKLRKSALFKFMAQGAGAVPTTDDTWNGYPLSEEAARALAERTGFEARYMAGQGTSRFWLWYFA